MYQAAQNVLHGFGSICGASLGGSIADTIGWRWCFFLQVPVSILALVMGHVVVRNPTALDGLPRFTPGLRSVWKQVDLSGTLLLVSGLSLQLVGLSLGGNELPWDNFWVIASLVTSVVLLGGFLVVEAKTSAVPVIPLRMLRGCLPVATQIANVGVGMAAYAVGYLHTEKENCADLVVSFHAPPLLPGCPLGFPFQGRGETGYPVASSPCRRTDSRHHHVPLGLSGIPSQDWSPAHVRRESSGDATALR